MKYYVVLEVNSDEYDEPTIHLLTKDRDKAYAQAKKIAKKLYNMVKKDTDYQVVIEDFPKYWLVRKYSGDNLGFNYWSAEIQILEVEES